MLSKSNSSLGKTQAFTFLFIFLSLITFAGTPINGTTAFNSVSGGLKASGSASGSGITAADIEGFDFRLTTTNGAPTMNIEVWDGSVSSGNGVALYESTSTTNPLFSGIFITANSSAQFDLISIGINAQSSASGDATVTITGLDGSGNPISGATTSGTASVSSLTTFNVNSINQFKGIRGIRITSSDVVYAFIDNIELQNVALSTLPVSWIDFTAKPENQSAVRLNWLTSSEQNTDHYSVLHSTNGQSWETIGTVAAASNSTTVSSYIFLHNHPFAGNNYYRLQQVDLDGNRSYSKIISIVTGLKNNRSVFPNPVVRNTSFSVQLKQSCTIELYNNTGQLVLQKYLPAGMHSISVGSIPAGVYRLKEDNKSSSIIIQ
ncbi:T9SS type A sorting domain-containing protein [Lacibacter sp. H407]|uniref:T9SS type A sorting domain-containing protein n=1 Tax=Lacibacter sp. H407 TaxID=3133423 RepID=UPI0030C2B870